VAEPRERVSFKSIKVHLCRRAYFEDGPIDCRCKRHVTKARAENLVREGLADYRTFPTGRVNNLEIVLRKHRPLRPARTIDEAAIVNAFCEGNAFERKRIEIYASEEKATFEKFISEEKGTSYG
jgi:hypothetical protein